MKGLNRPMNARFVELPRKDLNRSARPEKILLCFSYPAGIRDELPGILYIPIFFRSKAKDDYKSYYFTDWIAGWLSGIHRRIGRRHYYAACSADTGGL